MPSRATSPPARGPQLTGSCSRRPPSSCRRRPCRPSCRRPSCRLSRPCRTGLPSCPGTGHPPARPSQGPSWARPGHICTLLVYLWVNLRLTRNYTQKWISFLARFFLKLFLARFFHFPFSKVLITIPFSSLSFF